MSGPQQTMPFTIESIDQLISNLEIITSPDFKAAEWPRLEPKIENGTTIYQMPYPEYDELVLKTIADLCRNAYIDPYGILPEDPPGLEDGLDTVGVLKKSKDFETATLDQIRRYIIITSRGERFCDGHIEGEILNGNFAAALNRLKFFRSTMQS